MASTHEVFGQSLALLYSLSEPFSGFYLRFACPPAPSPPTSKLTPAFLLMSKPIALQSKPPRPGWFKALVKRSCSKEATGIGTLLRRAVSKIKETSLCPNSSANPPGRWSRRDTRSPYLPGGYVFEK